MPSTDRFKIEASDRRNLRRLLAMSWKHAPGCVKVLTLQLVILALGIYGLVLGGIGIDTIHHALNPVMPAARWPFGYNPFGIVQEPLHQVLCIAVFLLGVAALKGYLSYWYAVLLAELVEHDIVVELRTQVYDKLQRLSFRFFDANATGSLINRVTGDSRAVVTFVNGVLIQGLVILMTLAVFLAYMFTLSIPLTLACLATTPLLWLVTYRFTVKVRPLYGENRELVDTLISRYSESIQGIQVVKGFGAEGKVREEFVRVNARIRDQQGEIFQRVSRYNPTVGFLTQVNLGVLLLYGGWLVNHGGFPLGAGLVVFVGLLLQFAGQVAAFASIANTAQQSIIAARRVFEVLDTPVEIQDRSDAKNVGRLTGAITFEDVWFEYKPGEPVLQGVSFDIKPGECVAILGQTGSGKSALLSLIPRFFDPARGRVTMDGYNIAELGLDDLRRNVGLVFQESFLFSNTIAANIRFGHPDATDAQMVRAAQIAAADGFIRELPEGYETLLGESGLNL
ncbi:MAG: ABC transporter ATP-binding protein, partial [Verrucomicrobiae bacterium]|nr:ABC transporter ATP-binding protein [Verrucomicrobiae bacterium]